MDEMTATEVRRMQDEFNHVAGDILREALLGPILDATLKLLEKEAKKVRYEVWVTEHKYEDVIAWKGDSLDEARKIMSEQVGEMMGSPPVFDQDSMSMRMIHPQSGLEYWKVEIKEVRADAA